MKKKIVTAEKRWIYVSAGFLFLLTILAIIPAIEETKRPQMLFASRDMKIDANLITQKDPNRPQHKHPAFKERSAERERMVAVQIQVREVKDPNVLTAMRAIPRHAFIPDSEKSLAYIDSALPIAENQTISQPYIVAFMTQALQLKNNSKVLEIGTGSGYQAAVCAEIAKEVYTIEIVEELAKSAEKVLKELGYTNVFVKFGDGFFGWPEHAPFDAIIGTAAAEQMPQPLIDQLKPGGRMILPYEDAVGLQYLVLITKDAKGELHKETVLPVRFVPMTGEIEKQTKRTEN
jgi:protein-L-isoaspartate(D-aspartate) O-methyltransferase